MSKFDAISHRLILEKWINEYGWKIMVEVGVKKGNTFLYLLDNCINLKLIGVDIWENKIEKLPEYEQKLREAIANRYPQRATLTKLKSVDAAIQFADNSLDCVFIDADHSEKSVREDIVAWWPKVKIGGFLSGHDINILGVRKAVDALCPGWRKHDQQVWSIECKEPQIFTSVPYADDRNFGQACNDTMSLLPNDGWACLLDHDAVFTTREWHRQLTTAVMKRRDGCFSVMTNRIKCEWQQVLNVNIKNHDIQYHRDIGHKLLLNKNLRDVTNDNRDRTPAGVVMVLSKQAWKDAGGFPQGLHYVDRMMWMALKFTERRIYIIEGLYVYHWHRGDNEPIQKGEWAVQHTLPDGRVLKIKNIESLPVYGI